ncbi:low-affinity phosphate transporter [Podospora pseudopauciseta]|uniref:Low-affinity phosphate transporter n=1 Tax=Podospora pseudopauciseta TaxID=2093780 RepID=A0ABR0HFX3_9PEZI|nr:low-affinity phosphate transporter [Podospora pseudopauciseta]
MFQQVIGCQKPFQDSRPTGWWTAPRVGGDSPERWTTGGPRNDGDGCIHPTQWVYLCAQFLFPCCRKLPFFCFAQHAVKATSLKITPPSAFQEVPSSLYAPQEARRPHKTSDLLVRGGSSSSSTVGEEYELAEYKAGDKQREREREYNEKTRDRQRRYNVRRAEKRRWLEHNDEMKFSHSIQFNAVPDWSNHYIAYSTLKKLIYSLEKSIHLASGGDGESRPLIQHDDPETIFTRALDVELEKITSFYVIKEKELTDEVDALLKEVAAFEEGADEHTRPATRSSERPQLRYRSQSARSRHSTEDDGQEDSDDDDGDGEATGLTKRRRGSFGRRRTIPNAMLASTTDMTASTELTRSLRRLSVTYDDYAEQAALFSSGIMLKKKIIDVYVRLCELKSYSQLNRTGFNKILKKFDKICDRRLRSKYMSSFVDSAYPFKPETTKSLEEHIQRIVQAYAEIVTDGDEAAATKDLRSHLREHVVWERNTVWRELIGLERRAEAASLGHTLLGRDADPQAARLQGDDDLVSPTKAISTPLGRFNLPTWLVSSTMFALVVIFAIFVAMLLVPIMEKPEQQNCLAILVFVSLLWATEAIPLFVTSLTIPFLCVVLQVFLDKDEPHKRLGAKDATAAVFAAMWTPVIMLLLGGFTLAAALSKCYIDKRIATFVLSKAGTKPKTVLIANMAVAAVASMLISNVAAPVLCFGIIEPMLRNLPSGSDMSKAVIIGIALASNIGGMLSPIASPQNVVAIGIMEPAPTWGQWFFIVIPVGIISLVLIWILLLVTFKPGRGTTIVPTRPIKDPFTGIQWFVTIVTVATIGLWCASHTLENVFGDMGVIAIIPIVLFFGVGILTKEDFNNFPWTIIILAAGGLSLGKAVNSSGLLHTVTREITAQVEDFSLYGILVVFSTLILVIATFISHTVAALIILPLVYNVGKGLEEPHPNLLVMTGVLMCSAAMGLPTSGFPNMTAIMKEDPAGQRYLQVKHFISRGVPSSVLTLVVVVTVGYGAMRVSGM